VTRQTLETVQADIARIAKEHPNAVMLAALEVLIELAAGDNPALRDYKKLQIYRGIRHTLSKRGF
jgi:hypothetical protein